MAISKIKEVLTDLGLSDSETRVYLAMVELGPESVQNIAKKASISRTAAYDVINSLQEKGIASTYRKGKKKLFSAEDPGKLKTYFKQRLAVMKDQFDELKRMVPELRVMQAEDRPMVRFFSGNDGLRALFRDVEEVRSDLLLEVTNGKVVYESLDIELMQEFRKSNFFAKLPMKTLYWGGDTPRNPKAKTELRALKKEFGDFTGNIWIYKNRVAFMNFIGEPETVIIESQVFADSMKVLFNAAWESATPYQNPNK